MGTLSMKVVLTFQMHRYIVSIAILKLLNQDYQIFVFAINDEVVSTKSSFYSQEKKTIRGAL